MLVAIAMVLLGVLGRAGVIEGIGIFRHPLFTMLGLAIGLLGWYSPKYGFGKSREHQGDASGTAPGASFGKQSDGSGGDGGSGGGDG